MGDGLNGDELAVLDVGVERRRGVLGLVVGGLGVVRAAVDVVVAGPLRADARHCYERAKIVCVGVVGLVSNDRVV